MIADIPRGWQINTARGRKRRADLVAEDQQAIILEMLKTRKMVRSREFIRECQGWDFRKAITRLRRQGFPIRNISPPGQEATYIWADGEQGRLI